MPFKGFTRPASASLRSRQMPYPAGYATPDGRFPGAFRRLALAFRDVLCPLWNSASLTRRRTSSRTTAGFPRSALVSCNRVGRSLYSGVVVSTSMAEMNHTPLTHPPPQAIHGGSSMTKPQWEFTRVRPSGFSLACGILMAGCSWAFPWASHRAVTSAARQGENRRWTRAWGRG
jgi:hypothetical protein